MMVSKIAVIALVAIVACPILIGYAMNLNEVTVTDYRGTGESVNVTPLYQNGVDYSYAAADVYALNTNFDQGYSTPVKVWPQYESNPTTVSSLPLFKWVLGAGVYSSAQLRFSNYKYFYFQSDWDGSTGGYLNITVTDPSNNVYATQSKIHTVFWNEETMTLSVTYDAPAYRSLEWSIPATNYTFKFTATGTYTATGLYERDRTSSAEPYSTYADISAGFRLTNMLSLADNTWSNDSLLNNNKVGLNLPEYPNNVLMTMDLNTITDSSYDLIFELQGYGTFTDYYTLRKTTDSGGVHWNLYRGRPYSGLTNITELYYDSSRLSNTYQLYIDNTGLEFRYVGNWPTMIGQANYYQTFRYDRDFSYYIGGLKKINFWNNTPLMRVDASEYRAFEYPIIENQTYNPADFKTNPATTLSGNMIYGRSLTFGGTTYTVTDGNITLGTHKIPVKDMVLDSIPNDIGSYDNRINGTKVSESANPATITFNGQWSASISTIAQEGYTYTKTEWTAGSFGWDGIDQNFLMVGLLTCLGVFVALGIYARKRGTGGLIPLMIVTGCAAAVFFIML